jgi:hypothetical protein
MTFALDWTGNVDGTFSAPTSVTLPLNQTVPVTIRIEPKAAGAHTAMLTLANEAIPGFSHRMLTTIVVGEPLNASNSYTTQQKTEVPRPEMRSFFYDGWRRRTGWCRWRCGAPGDVRCQRPHAGRVGSSAERPCRCQLVRCDAG